jgi:cell division protein FtsL
MMERWMPLALFGLIFFVLMIVLQRYQTRKYQEYLGKHVAVNDKMRENQERLIDQQERSIAAAERNAAALDRIAIALEKRP